MTAVSIDAAVSSSSGFRPIANPIAPVDTPNLIAADNVPSTSAPSVFPANSLPSELPPFPLNHPRILYDNLLIGSTVTNTTGTSPTHVLIPNTANRWEISVDGSITFTLPINTNIDSIGIGAHNLSGCTITATYNSGTAFASVTPVNNIAVFFHLGTAVGSDSIKISITNVGSTDRFIGAIYAGIALQMQRPYFGGSTPINLSRVTKFYSSRTEAGNVIGREIRSQNFSTDVDFSNLSNGWYRTYFDPFVESARRYPYFYAWNLLKESRDIGYVETTEDIAPSYTGTRDLFSVSFSLLGVG